MALEAVDDALDASREQKRADRHDGLEQLDGPVRAAGGLEPPEVGALALDVQLVILAGIRADRQSAATVAGEEGAAAPAAIDAHGQVLGLAARPLHQRRVRVDQLVLGDIPGRDHAPATCRAGKAKLPQ